ncbi:MAG: HlyD family efflux transporter periplasmic adaptor subunit [Phycisphaerales bacterium]|nr:HlyD family efflux transporter periplasmic adaptor subunit [Phycisphaerales bacterium]
MRYRGVLAMDTPHLSMRTRIVRGLIALGMLVGSVTILIVLAMTRPLPGSTERREAVQRIAVFHPKRMNLARQWIGYGTVRALDSADIPARVGATVVEISPAAKAGSVVTAGQFLVQLDALDFRRTVDGAMQQIAAIDSQLASIALEEEGLVGRLGLAKEDAALSKKDEERTRDAVQSGAANQRELDRSRQQTIAMERSQLLLQEAFNQLAPRRGALMAQREIQRMQQTTAQTNQDRCRITSPIAGTLQAFELEVGESVVATQVVARVVNVSSVEIPIRLPGAARGSVRVGDRVEFKVVPRGTRAALSTVARIEPEDNPLERTMTVYVEVKQSGDGTDSIAPGEFAEAMVQTRDSIARTAVPRRSVRAERVMQLIDGKVIARPVVVSHTFRGAIAESGVSDIEWLVLEEPLPDGIVVAVDGGRRIAPGTVVEAIAADLVETPSP